MKSIQWNMVFGVAMAAAGLAVGYIVAKPAAAEDAADDHHAGEDPTFTERSLANLGVEVGGVKLTSFTEYEVVQAVVRDAPLNVRPLPAPLPGVVSELSVEPGTTVAPGSVVATVLRDAVPRPVLEFTKEIFTPVSESMHEAFSELRLAVRGLAVIEKEIQRIDAINAKANAGDPPLIGGRVRIQLGYDREKATERVSNARIELEHHGLTEAEIRELEKGGHPPRGQRLWQRVLEVHGQWTPDVQKIFTSLSAEDRERPWSIAMLGELSSAGLVNKDLAVAFAAEPAMARHFADCVGLLLQGEPAARVRWLAAQGALESQMKIVAPKGTEWDVAQVVVREGEQVAKGSPLMQLHDPRKMRLRILPVGDEIGSVQRAVRERVKVAAHPLLAGTGPVFEGLRIARVMSAEGGGGDIAYIEVANERLGDEEGSVRSWRLRAGMRYEVRLPRKLHEKVFVLRRDAVTKEGADQVVYLRNGDSFKASAVRVLYENDRVIVLANDGAIFPDDQIVVRGAFAIGQAMQQSAGGGGHHHHHH